MNDFIAGMIGGLSGLVVGYPFDTIKALMQTREGHSSIIKSTSLIIAQTKSAGFFRGVGLPFITYGPITSLGFGVYGNSLKFLEKENIDCPRYLNVFIAGSLSGFILSPIKNPFEIIRIQLQTHCKDTIHGPRKCIEELINTKGYLGFLKGLDALILRLDIIRYNYNLQNFLSDHGHNQKELIGIYFCVFNFYREKGTTLNLNGFLVDLIAGGLAGCTSWASVLPIDTIKSRIQANRNDNNNFFKEFFIIYSKFGVRGFYKGLTAVLIRAFIVNSFTLCFYRQSLNILNNCSYIYQY